MKIIIFKILYIFTTNKILITDFMLQIKNMCILLLKTGILSLVKLI